jgi:hypothetical protein
VRELEVSLIGASKLPNERIFGREAGEFYGDATWPLPSPNKERHFHVLFRTHVGGRQR